MTGAVLLLPPSEGKSVGGDGPPWGGTTTGEGVLAADRRALVAALQRSLRDPDADPADVLRYGSDDVLARAVEVDLAIDTAPTMPAIERYTGVVLDGIDGATLAADGRRRLERDTWFVSGCWGLLAATDPIPDYRVKIGAKVPGLGVLGTWWRPRITPVLDQLVAGRLVWNLLPTEHARVWRPGGTAAAVATVEFTTRARGRRGVSNFHGKHLKGRFVRHLVSTDPTDVAAASAFTTDDWSLDPAASTLEGADLHLVFAAP